MKKILFLLFMILSLNAISTISYLSIPNMPWLYDISIVGHEYWEPSVVLTRGENIDMTILTDRLDHDITKCVVKVIFKSGITPYTILNYWELEYNSFVPNGNEIRIYIYDIVDGDRWPLGAVVMEIYVEDQNGYVIGAAKIDGMLIL